MTALLTGLVTLVVFGVVILVHELGHFLAARRCGIRVQEFSIGFGPAVWSREKNGTRYTIRLLPLGGYNLFTPLPENEDGDSDGAGEPDTPGPSVLLPEPKPRKTGLFPVTVQGQDFEEAPANQRFFVILCGALMNFVLGAVLLVVLVASTSRLGGTTVAQFFPDAASQTSLQVGDRILRVDGTATTTSWQLAACFGDPETRHTIQVLRSGELLTLQNVAVGLGVNEEAGTTSPMDFYVSAIPKTPQNVLTQAAAQFRYYAGAILGGFVELATGQTGTEELSGPVGVVSAVSQAISYGWRDVVSLAALLTINLGIFNLLPIPALDGFKLLFLGFEWLTGHAVPQRVQIAVNTAGMVMLLWLMVFVTMQDIGRFIG